MRPGRRALPPGKMRAASLERAIELHCRSRMRTRRAVLTSAGAAMIQITGGSRKNRQVPREERLQEHSIATAARPGKAALMSGAWMQLEGTLARSAKGRHLPLQSCTQSRPQVNVSRSKAASRRDVPRTVTSKIALAEPDKRKSASYALGVRNRCPGGDDVRPKDAGSGGLACVESDVCHVIEPGARSCGGCAVVAFAGLARGRRRRHFSLYRPSDADGRSALPRHRRCQYAAHLSDPRRRRGGRWDE